MDEQVKREFIKEADKNSAGGLCVGPQLTNGDTLRGDVVVVSSVWKLEMEFQAHEEQNRVTTVAGGIMWLYCLVQTNKDIFGSKQMNFQVASLLK